MLKLKKSYLLIALVAVSLVYILIQLLFINKLKNGLLSNHENVDGDVAINIYNSKFIRGRKYVVGPNEAKAAAAAAGADSSVRRGSRKTKKTNLTKLAQINIPLDALNNNQPHLIYLLPFYHRFSNYFNFTSYFINEPPPPPALDVYYYDTITISSKNNHKKSKKNKNKNKVSSYFVGIESENKMINKNLLKTYDLTESNKINKSTPTISTPSAINKINLNNLRGIDKSKFNLYRPVDNGLFKCINSNQKIPYEQLNDDFCDCVDGTDEPGTSACQFAIFFCSTQNEYLTENFIQSSRVDDKICDCCDGSDESPPHIINCPNKCDEIISELKKSKNEKKLASKLKQKYLVDGLFKNNDLYGPQGVFYLLSKSCFDIKWSEYVFEVCPYKKVTQFKGNHKSQGTNLGTQPTLLLTELDKKKLWIIKMDNGDATYCSSPRRSEIFLNCGTKEELKSIEEPEKCVYKFQLITPAAC